MTTSRIEVSPEMLAEFLKLPPWVTIVGAENGDHRIVLTVTGQYCAEGASITPVYRREPDGSVVLAEMLGANT